MTKEKIKYYLAKMPPEVVYLLCVELLTTHQTHNVEQLFIELFEELKRANQ